MVGVSSTIERAGNEDLREKVTFYCTYGAPKAEKQPHINHSKVSAFPTRRRPRPLRTKRMGARASTPTSSSMDFEIKKTDEEWRAQLSPEEFKVIRGKGTERPRSGEYDKAST